MTLPHALPTPARDFYSPLALVTPEERDRIGELLDQSLSDRTRAVYRSAWNRFADWCLRRGTPSLPADPVVLAAYFSHLFNDLGRTVTTVRLQRSAISSVHRLSGHPDPAADPGVVRLLAGISRAGARPQRQARGLTSDSLAAIRATSSLPRVTGPAGRRESEARSRRRTAVDVALLAVMRDGLLRISEAAALRWRDIDFQPDGTALLTVASSKTDQEGEGAVLYLGHGAAEALRDLAVCHRGVDLELTVFGLGPRQLARRIDAAARAAGLGAGFTGHSARVGMAQDLVSWGAELPALMVAGRWRSSRMPARYSERQLVARGLVARYYASRRPD